MISYSGSTTVAPRRLDSPPISTTSAPSAINRLTCAIGFAGEKELAPSVKLRGYPRDSGYNWVIGDEFVRAGTQPARLLHRAELLASFGHAGAISGPPNSGGFAALAAPPARIPSQLPAAAPAASAAVQASRHAPAVALRHRSVFRNGGREPRPGTTVRGSQSNSFARGYASSVTRVTCESHRLRGALRVFTSH